MPIDATTQLMSALKHSHPHQKLDPHDELTQKAQQLVSQSFFGTLLKQAHQSPFKSEMFEGGKGGSAYQELFDQKIAEHMSRGVGSKIVRPLVNKFQAGKAYARHKASAKLGASAKRGHHSFLDHSAPGRSENGAQTHQASAFLAKFLGA